MHDFLATLPLGHIGVGFIGVIVYLLTSLVNPADESFASVTDVFIHKGRTVLTAALVTPILVVAAQNAGELNVLSAFCAGYLNLSILRKVTDGWASKAKLTGN
jgi:hypothetical protein